MKNTMRQREKKTKTSQGIALPEIMVIISLIIILALVSYPRFYDTMAKASRDGALVASDAIIKAVAMYQMDLRNFPADGPINALWNYTSTTSLLKAYSIVTLLQKGTGMCAQGVVSGIGSASAGEEYHVANCYRVSGLNPGGYCCMSPNAKTGTNNCTVSGTSPYYTGTNWFECKGRLY